MKQTAANGFVMLWSPTEALEKPNISWHHCVAIDILPCWLYTKKRHDIVEHHKIDQTTR